jgi:hypothetical protein
MSNPWRAFPDCCRRPSSSVTGWTPHRLGHDHSWGRNVITPPGTQFAVLGNDAPTGRASTFGIRSRRLPGFGEKKCLSYGLSGFDRQMCLGDLIE